MKPIAHPQRFVARLLLAAGFLCQAAAAERRSPLPEGTTLALPTNSGLSVTTVLPVNLKAHTVPAFDVDAGGTPWFGYGHTILANPLKKLAVEIDAPCQSFTWLDTGELVLCSSGSVGVLSMDSASAPKNTNTLPILHFSPVFQIPSRRAEAFPGTGGSLYLSGKTKAGWEILQLSKTGEVGTVRKLLTLQRPVSSVAGDESTTYVASERSVARIPPGGDHLVAVFTHPTKTINQLDYVPATGLFYTTDTHVGYLAPDGKATEFLRTPHPRIRVRNDALYILLGPSCYVLKIGPADKFSSLGKQR